jgi:hypothetical protein
VIEHDNVTNTEVLFFLVRSLAGNRQFGQTVMCPGSLYQSLCEFSVDFRFQRG